MSVPASMASFFFRRVGASNLSASYNRSLSGSRTASNSIKLYCDGTLNTTSTTADSGAVVAGKWCHGGMYNNSTTLSDPTSYTAQVETLGGGLSDSEMAQLNTISLAYCTARGFT